MNACIDIGNTNLKTGIFLGDSLTLSEIIPSLPLQNIYKILDAKDFNSIILSSVVELPGHIIKYITSKSKNFIQLTSTTQLPFQNRYQSPDSLGSDRIAQAAGAQALFPSQNVLSITAGSCLVYDFIDAKSNYLGGAISPGMEMRFKSLANYTAKLPLIFNTSGDKIPLIGNNTNNSILSGVINGMIFEIGKAVEKYESEYNNLHCIISGGDGRYLANSLTIPLIIEPDLTLIGLNKILQFNAKKHN